MTVFTDENFTGYEFRCTTESANTGFKHVCRVFKDNIEVEGAKAVVNWGNRTWEPYTYASVFEGAKSNLEAKLSGVKEPEVDYDFLNRLANDGHIFDYGNFEDGTPIIIFDSWEQVEGVYTKLVELAEKNLLKPSINSTMQNVEYVFSDEYNKCTECGTVHNTYYGDLTVIDDMLLCDQCVNTPSRVRSLIEEAQEEVKPLKATVSHDTLKELGYSLATDETFSHARDFYGATYISGQEAKEFVEKYNGFAQTYAIYQWVAPFYIWVHNSKLEEAKQEIAEKFNMVVA